MRWGFFWAFGAKVILQAAKPEPKNKDRSQKNETFREPRPDLDRRSQMNVKKFYESFAKDDKVGRGRHFKIMGLVS
jgi:hypothetical protein